MPSTSRRFKTGSARQAKWASILKSAATGSRERSTSAKSNSRHRSASQCFLWNMRTRSLKASAWAIATSSVLLLAIPAESSVVYRVPYENGGRSYASAIYLEVPVQTIEKSWLDYRDATGAADDAEQALRELLRGIYARQFDQIEARVAATAIQAMGGVQKYVDGFRASLHAASNLSVIGKLSGADVRFMLRDGSAGPYKLLRFSKGDGARFVLDQMKPPGQIDRL